MTQSITIALMAMFILLQMTTGVLNAASPQLTQQAAAEIHGKQWLNSTPLTLAQLKGKVVIVEFWTYGCYNCVNVEPYIKQWYGRYKDKGFEVIAVHSPEFRRERNLDNVRSYIERKEIRYPVVIDNNFAIWRRYKNRYWPTLYLIDKQGQIRYRSIGEGRYQKTEEQIQMLLAE